MKYHKEVMEIIFHARGGQGAKTASEIIAETAVEEGKFAQAFPYFGPERSGAPTKTFIRISNQEIRTHEAIDDPDAVVVLDETLLSGKLDLVRNLDKNEFLIINTKKSSEEIKAKLGGFQGKIYAIDASGISQKIIGQPRPNTAILGKLIQVTEVVKLASLCQKFREKFEPKIGKEFSDKNILAIEKAYDSI